MSIAQQNQINALQSRVQALEAQIEQILSAADTKVHADVAAFVERLLALENRFKALKVKL